MVVDLDLGGFADEKFDAKRWINGAWKAMGKGGEVDNLSDLEMKLQLIYDDISSSLEEHSASSLMRVPRANREIVRLKDDAVSLRSVLSSALSSISLSTADGSSAAESVATLARLDAIKSRMEAAYETLQDAAGLTKLSATVEDVFASGDLPRAAETLANMRHCLSVVGEVSEFANVKKQLEVLEERLEGMVQPRLVDALTYRKVDVAQDLRNILIRIGRYRYLEQQYIKTRAKPLRKLWEDFDVGNQTSNRIANQPMFSDREHATKSTTGISTYGSFSSWLPHFYDGLLLELENEWKWCSTAFPEDYKLLVPNLLIETMTSISTSFVTRIDFASGDVTAGIRTLTGDASAVETLKSSGIKAKHLELLIELQNMTTAFTRNISYMFADIDLTVLATTLRAIYSPFESYKQRYGELELAILASEVASLDLRGAVQRGVGAQGVELSETVRRMEESVPQINVFLEAAIQRCINFTGGSEAEALIHAIDETLLQYLGLLNDILKSLRLVGGIDNSGTFDSVNKRKESGPDTKEHGKNLLDSVSEEEEWSIVQGALQLLTVAESLSSRSSVFEASLRATLTRLNTIFQVFNFASSSPFSTFSIDNLKNQESLTSGSQRLDIGALRLIDSPDKARKLSSLLEQAKDPRFHALSRASQKIAAFSNAVNDLVYEVLMLKVRHKLRDVSRMTIWTSVESSSAFALPSFSVYPQAYVTSIGEYLLTLPQQLEPLMAGVGATGSNTNQDTNFDEAQIFAAEWIFKVAEGAISLYIEQLRGIQSISDRGAQQLSADIEYLCNVLSALSMPTPPVLATFQMLLSTPREKIRDFIKSDAGNQLDLPTTRLVCKIRHITLE